MTIRILPVVAAFLAISGETQSLSIFNTNSLKPNAAFREFVKEQTGTMLNIHLDVGKKADPARKNANEPRMNANGLVLELHSESLVPSSNHPAMPGANGPHPKLGSGIRSLSIKEDASFIDMNGMQRIPLKNGCWEMVWRDDAPAGSLICGFDLPTEVKRNEASLPKGTLYISFPVWTKAGLVESQSYKATQLEKASKYIAEKNEHFDRCMEESNIIMKALHYRNAAVATVACQKLETDSSLIREIPSDDDVMSIGFDMMLTTKGTIWTKDSHVFGGRQVFLGVASACPGATVDNLHEQKSSKTSPVMN